MTRNEQILSEVQKRFSSNDTHLVSKISTFIDGAKWADEHPNPEIIKRVFLYALQNTNILLADDWDEVRWDLLIKKAMKE
jgi:hypothetical protein